MMRILALDTTSLRGSVALQENKRLAGQVYLATTTDHSASLLGTIDFLLASAGISLDQIDGFAVAAGPGSFSGIRIGLATAKGLAQNLAKPIVAVSALHALAFRVRFLEGLICPMIDALRSQVYTTLFRPGADDVEALSEPVAVAPAEWLAALPDTRIAFLGDGANRYAEQIVGAGRGGWKVLPVTPYLAEAIAELGERRLERGEGARADEVDGLYIRASDAEIAKAARQARLGTGSR